MFRHSNTLMIGCAVLSSVSAIASVIVTTTTVSKLVPATPQVMPVDRTPEDFLKRYGMYSAEQLLEGLENHHMAARIYNVCLNTAPSDPMDCIRREEARAVRKGDLEFSP